MWSKIWAIWQALPDELKVTLFQLLKQLIGLEKGSEGFSGPENEEAKQKLVEAGACTSQECDEVEECVAELDG